MSKDEELKFICYFLIIATFIYVFTGLLGVNLPAYYPVLHIWSVAKIDKAVSMAYYSKVAFTLITALVITSVQKVFLKGECVNEELLLGATKGVVLFGIFFFLAEEWHIWGIEKMRFDTQNFFNYEFWYFSALTILFVSLICYITGFCTRKNK